ncbi:major facilitator superfamily protein, partial [Kipferlia bialata]
CLVAATMSMISALMSLLFLPETAPIRIARNESQLLNIDMDSAPKESGLKKTLELMSRNKNLVIVFIGYTITLGGHCLFKDMMGPIVRTRCGLDPDIADIMYSYTMTIGTLFGTLASFSVGPIIKRVGERGAIYGGQACNIISTSMMAFDTDGEYSWGYYTFAITLNGIGSAIDQPAFIHLCSEWSTPQDRGTVYI